MDRNTLIGMLLMGVVIFGFMWLQKPSEAEIAEHQRQMDSIAAAQKAEQRRDIGAGNVDTLSVAELATLKSVLQNFAWEMFGEKAHLQGVLENMPADNAVINNEGVVLALKEGKIDGTISVADTTVQWDEVTATTSANPAVHNLAVQAVQRALDVYAKNGSFATSLTGPEELVTLEKDSLKVEISTKGGVEYQDNARRNQSKEYENCGYADLLPHLMEFARVTFPLE